MAEQKDDTTDHADLANRLYMLADKINNMWGKSPDADLIRESAGSHWKMGKAQEESSSKPQPKTTSKPVTRKA